MPLLCAFGGALAALALFAGAWRWKADIFGTKTRFFTHALDPLDFVPSELWLVPCSMPGSKTPPIRAFVWYRWCCIFKSFVLFFSSVFWPLGRIHQHFQTTSSQLVWDNSGVSPQAVGVSASPKSGILAGAQPAKIPLYPVL